MGVMANQSNLAKFLVIAAAFVIVIAGMRAAEAILVPFLLSIFTAVLCSPFLNWLHEKGAPYWLAIILIIVAVVLFWFGIGAVVGSSINSFTEDLPTYEEKLSAQLVGFFAWLAKMGVSVDQAQLREVLDPAIAMKMAGATLASLGNVMTNAFLIILVVIFILAEEAVFYDKIKAASRGSERSMEALEQFTASINRYMAIKTLLSLLTGGAILIWLLILGVDYAILWALLAFLLNFIPNLGSILAAIPAVLLTIVQLGPLSALLVAIGYVTANTVVGNVLEPRWMGKGLDLSPLVVLLSLVFWGWVLGPVGMLLSVPLTMTVKIAMESSEDTRPIAIMLGSGAGLSKEST